MDATKRPLAIPPEISNYAEKHGIFDLYKRLLSELIIHKPDDPLDFMISFLKQDDDDVPRILVIGPPAAGKGSVARMLCKSLGLTHITMTSVMAEADSSLVHDAQQCLDNELPIASELLARLVHSRLQVYDAVKKGWVMDSIIETRDQALALSALGVCPKHVVLLHAPDTVLIERASGKRIDPDTGDIYHVTFDYPTNSTIAGRLEEVPGCTDTEVIDKLVIFHRNIDGVKACYEHVTRTINADQPKADIFSQVMAFVCQQARSAAPRTPRIILIGPRGSGKSTQAALLANKYHIVNVSCGQLIKQAVASMSSTGHACKSYVDKGLPVPDAIVLQLLKKRLSHLDCASRGWVLHGYPRTHEQAEILEGAGFVSNRIFFLDISNEAVFERLTLRAIDSMTGNQYHLLYNPPRTQEIKSRLQVDPNDAEEAVMAQLSEYQAYREELVEYYDVSRGGQRVNADQDTHTVFETIESMIVNQLPKCTNNSC